ncbi:DUF6881 domain-containing protein [Pseudoalteromonas ardens]|uniref:DUF6881 domain-containing protein n=1 Tax=Pseudoalteromonas rubra TaxID=43658 RepID=A0A0L0EPF2_9GAMM|nr:hypothetical protein [Pseudoalteromonas sp. R96]KNC66271.1 hypothetical protein AC626_18030 [Pseudoalteromonas rubra]MDK1311969.1 hypothetical protein [Pseudoalteromonas sp. R96]
MNYIKVKWVHNFTDEPVWLYSELNDSREETRKVEIFPDGSYCYAYDEKSSGTTLLSITPLPTLEEIAEDPQFLPEEIQIGEFEEAWAKAVSG